MSDQTKEKVMRTKNEIPQKLQMELMAKIQKLISTADKKGVVIVVGNKYSPDSFVLAYGSKEIQWRFDPK